MLENKKFGRNFRKMGIALMVIIVSLGVYINVKFSKGMVIEASATAAQDVGHVKDALTLASINLDKRKN